MNSCLKQIAISCKPEITLDKTNCCSHLLPPLRCMFLSTNEQDGVHDSCHQLPRNLSEGRWSILMSAPLRNLISSTTKQPAIQSTSPVIPVYHSSFTQNTTWLRLSSHPIFPRLDGFTTLPNQRTDLHTLHSDDLKACRVNTFRPVGDSLEKICGSVFDLIQSRKAPFKGHGECQHVRKKKLICIFVILWQKFIERKKGIYLRYIYISSCI